MSAQIGMALATINLFCTLAVLICGHLDCLTVDIDELEMSRNGPQMDSVLDAIVKKHIKIFEFGPFIAGLRD